MPSRRRVIEGEYAYIPAGLDIYSLKFFADDRHVTDELKARSYLNDIPGASLMKYQSLNSSYGRWLPAPPLAEPAVPAPVTRETAVGGIGTSGIGTGAIVKSSLSARQRRAGALFGASPAFSGTSLLYGG